MPRPRGGGGRNIRHPPNKISPNRHESDSARSSTSSSSYLSLDPTPEFIEPPPHKFSSSSSSDTSSDEGTPPRQFGRRSELRTPSPSRSRAALSVRAYAAESGTAANPATGSRAGLSSDGDGHSVMPVGTPRPLADTRPVQRRGLERNPADGPPLQFSGLAAASRRGGALETLSPKRDAPPPQQARRPGLPSSPASNPGTKNNRTRPQNTTVLPRSVTSAANTSAGTQTGVRSGQENGGGRILRSQTKKLAVHDAPPVQRLAPGGPPDDDSPASSPDRRNSDRRKRGSGHPATRGRKGGPGSRGRRGPGRAGARPVRRIRLNRVDAEIRYYQGNTGLLVRKLPFIRLVQEVSQGFGDRRWQTPAIDAVQAAAENFLVSFFEDLDRCADHANRKTILTRDSLLWKHFMNKYDMVRGLERILLAAR